MFMQPEPKFEKKDYKRISEMKMKDIFNSAGITPKSQEFSEDSDDFADLIKIEKKKRAQKLRKLRREAREKAIDKVKQKDKEASEQLQQAVDIPDLMINSEEQAMDLYKKQPLKARQLTDTERKELSELRRKAFSNDSFNYEEAEASMKEEVETPVAYSIKVQTNQPTEVAEIEQHHRKMEDQGVTIDDASPSDKRLITQHGQQKM
mmetsp:Transcript_40620/g.61891  ORF Transcript_40620/g.61891 Transcript_40620/m.61891 type:complete len:206 (+) Transcript_40620:485-1102(+)